MQLVFYTETEMTKANREIEEAYQNVELVTKQDLMELKGKSPVDT